MVLHDFSGPDGAAPLFGVLRDSAGALYGAAIWKLHAKGAIFKLTPQTGGGYSESLLHTFHGSDGNAPWGIVMDKRGALYGVTLLGGNYGCPGGCGAVFKITPSGTGYTEQTLYEFRPAGGDGMGPIGAPVLDKDGNVYGVTELGGSSNNGAIFKLTAASNYAESVIYNFPGGAGGSLPQAGLTIDSAGNIYGTANTGGNVSACPDSGGCGLVMELKPSGNGYTEQVLYRFKGSPSDGAGPLAPVTIDERDRKIFGTTSFGGAYLLNGVAFELTYSGVERVLHSFQAGSAGGSDPAGQLALASDGTLYGSTMQGGGGCNSTGCGAIYKLTPSGTGYTFGIVFDFLHQWRGSEPEFSTILLENDGSAYGTTRSGGTASWCNDGGTSAGCGVVFKLTL